MSALPSLAFAGIGLMGLPMCRRLQLNGHPQSDAVGHIENLQLP